MVDYENIFITAIRKHYISGDKKENILRSKMSREEIISHLEVSMNSNEVDLCIGELAYKRLIYVEKDQKISISIDGLCTGINIGNLCEYIENFIALDPEFRVKMHLAKIVNREPKLEAVTFGEWETRADFEKSLNINKSKIIKQFFEDKFYHMSICNSKGQETHLTLIDDLVSTKNECWVRFITKDQILHKNS